MKKAAAFLCAITLVLSLVAFNAFATEPKASGYKIGFSIYTQDIPSLNAMVQGFVDEAESLGDEVFIANAQNDIAKQIQNCEDLMTMEIDVLVINPYDSAGIVPAVEAANQKGIPVVMFDIDAKGGKRAAHITSDNHHMGQYAGEYLAYVLNGKGKVAYFDFPQLDIVKDRSDAFRAVMKCFPDIEIVADGIAVNREQSLPQMEAMLQAQPDIDAVYGINGGGAYGAYYACQAAGKTNIVVAGGDGEDEGVALIKSGSKYEFDAAHLSRLLGKLGGNTAHRVANGETLESYQILNPIYPITKDNVDHYPGMEADEYPDEKYMTPTWYKDPKWIALCETYGYTGWQN